ncbi:restriction endonuclease subunit S [candidate division TA06 bacterium]|uniref:Restriction endonuclease subunit S n=1 Tax=candidate division TA06 bacterium TaxID=2250710 RepID=A0A523UPU3_UNCT6|nr:MAG: restriction endonuclease subunit S [candidate division TA06 bacterium]
MKWRPYPIYRPTTKPWLDDTPHDWEIKRLKHTSHVKGRIGWQGLRSDEFTDSGPHLVTGTDFRRGRIDWDSCYHVSEERYSLDPNIQVREGDLLITKDGTIGKVAIVREAPDKACLNSGIFLIRPVTNGLTTAFLYWLMQSDSFTRYMEYSKSGATISHLYQNVFVEFAFPIPSVKEQRTIAEFLNRETAHIDGLIEKKRRQIGLLREKRAALISHAVTKGLNPDVKMKDSGMEWLGEIPVHWEIRRMKHVLFIRGGQVDPRVQQYAAMLLIAPNHIETRTGRILSAATAEDQGALSSKYVFRTGDVLYSKIRPELSKACIAPENGICSADMYAMVPKRGYVSNYLLYLLLSDVFTKLAVDESMRVAMPKINREDLGEVRFPFPPESEQLGIARYLDRSTVPLDEFISRIRSSIDLLREYRTALIAAAVTGKIDVHKWAVG